MIFGANYHSALTEVSMKILKPALCVAAFFLFLPNAYADQAGFCGGFCAGFSEGYKVIKGEMVIVPICPIRPIIPIGSTEFREGIKAGMRAAQH